jgi:hypothetical protein
MNAKDANWLVALCMFMLGREKESGRTFILMIADKKLGRE